MSSTTLQIDGSRLQSVQRAIPAGEALLVVLGDATAAAFLDNQRGVAVVAHMVPGAAGPISDVGLLITAEGVVATARAAAWAGTTTSGGAVTAVPVADFAAAVNGSELSVTTVEKEPGVQQGAWAADLVGQLPAAQTPKGSAAMIVATALNVKDAAGIEKLRMAAAACTEAFKKVPVKAKLEEALRAGAEGPTAEQVSQQLEAYVAHPDRIPGLERMDTTGFDSAFRPALVQSVPTFRLGRVLSAPVSSTERLAGPAVVVGLGCRCRGFSVYCARTYVTQPAAPEVVGAVTFARKVAERVREELRAGNTVAKVAEAALAFAEAEDAALAAKLVGNFGFPAGLHVHCAKSAIARSGTLTVEVGSAFVIKVALEGVAVVATSAAAAGDADEPQAVGGAAGPVGVLVADTVLVTGDGKESKTKVITKVSDADCTLTVRAKKRREEGVVPERSERVTRGAVATMGLEAEEQRSSKQRAVVKKKVEAWVAAGKPMGVDAGGGSNPEDATSVGRLANGQLQAYQAGAPPSAPAGSKRFPFVDRGHHSLVVPIDGALVPFHVSTIQKVDVGTDGSQHVFTVTLHTTQQSNYAFGKHRNRQWLRELTYQRAEGAPFYEAKAAFAELQQQLKKADAEAKKGTAVLTASANLSLAADAVKLPQVKIRPSPTAGVGARRGQGPCVGNVELHNNGLRFSHSGGRPVDIPFSNVKHLIVQPATSEVIVLLHLRLKQPMAIGDKPHQDVQFYVEVVESSEAATNTRRTEEEELAAEDAEKERIRKTNAQFAEFAAKAKRKFPEVALEVPFAEFEFDGVGNKRMVRFRGSKAALWAVAETFCVVSVGDVEVVSLERILPGQQNFDMMFLHKDYKTVTAITNVPMTKLEVVKDWLNEAELVFFEGNANIAWSKILKTMREDKEWEAWGREGWLAYVQGDEGEEGEGADSDDDPEDSDWEDDDSEDTSDDDDDDSDSDWAEEVSSDDESGGGSSDDSDESGNSWDELEQKAAQHDRKRGYDDDDDEAGARRQRRPAGGAQQRGRPQPPPGRR